MHATPQPPQFLASVAGSTQASAQKARPAAHWQLACEHVRPPLQAMPQAPQLALSVCSSTQFAPHRLFGA
jgi:hypothetical protein